MVTFWAQCAAICHMSLQLGKGWIKLCPKPVKYPAAILLSYGLYQSTASPVLGLIFPAGFYKLCWHDVSPWETLLTS